MNLGFEFAAVLLLFVCGGYFVDKKFGMLPACTIAGSVLGFAAAMYLIIRQARNIGRDNEQHKKP